MEKSGWLYCIRNPIYNLTKIGQSINIDNRLEHYKSNNGCFYMFVMAWRVKDYKKKEKEIHKLLVDYKYSTEWFVINICDVWKIVVDNCEILEIKVPDIVDVLTEGAKCAIEYEKIKLAKKGIVPIVSYKKAVYGSNIDAIKIVGDYGERCISILEESVI